MLVVEFTKGLFLYEKMWQDDDVDHLETSRPDPQRGARVHLSQAVDPHEAYLAGGPLGPVMRSYRSARIRRAKRKAQRRQMLALSIPILAFLAAVCSKGFFGSGLQSVSEAATQMFAAAKRGEFAEAATALYDAVRSFGSSVTARRLLLPIFLTVVLRMARAKLINSMNGSREKAEEAEDAGGASADGVTNAGSDGGASDQTRRPEDDEADALYLEWPRRLQHSISGLVIIVLYLVLPFYWALACVSVGECIQLEYPRL